MKKYIKSDSLLDRSRDNGKITDISIKLNEVMQLCNELEDFYFGEPVVDDIAKCYKFAEKALGCIDIANAKLN